MKSPVEWAAEEIVAKATVDMTIDDVRKALAAFGWGAITYAELIDVLVLAGARAGRVWCQQAWDFLEEPGC